MIRSTLDDLHNDHAALTVALRLAEYGARLADDTDGLATGAREPSDGYEETERNIYREVLRAYEDGAGAFEPNALVAWLKQRLAETANSIDAREGAGPPEPPTARVLVWLEGGIVQDVSADVPGVVVIVKDTDTDGADVVAVVADEDGDEAYYTTWLPNGDLTERTSVAIEAALAEKADAQRDAEREREEGAQP